MTGVNFASLIRYNTQTNSTTFSDADMVLLANTVKEDFAPKIADANEDLFGVPAIRDLVASDPTDFTKREYSLPEDNLNVKYVEGLLDGTTWIHLKVLDLNTYARSTDETTILANFSNDEDKAFYDIFRNSLWIYSGTLTAVVGGLKLWYIAFPADINAGTLALTTDICIDPTSTTAQIPRMFHELWARKTGIMYKVNRDKPIALNEHELNFDADFDKMISSLEAMDLDNSLVGKAPTNYRFQGL